MGCKVATNTMISPHHKIPPHHPPSIQPTNCPMLRIGSWENIMRSLSETNIHCQTNVQQTQRAQRTQNMQAESLILPCHGMFEEPRAGVGASGLFKLGARLGTQKHRQAGKVPWHGWFMPVCLGVCLPGAFSQNSMVFFFKGRQLSCCMVRMGSTLAYTIGRAWAAWAGRNGKDERQGRQAGTAATKRHRERDRHRN